LKTVGAAEEVARDTFGGREGAGGCRPLVHESDGRGCHARSRWWSWVRFLSMGIKNGDFIFKDYAISPLNLNPLPVGGEGAAFGHQTNSFVQQHGYHGAHGVTRPTKIGPWEVSGPERNRELSMRIKKRI
jgi:hypothetical protein